jgi:hypothetical protein
MNCIDFNRICSAIYGNPAWSVKKGHGSFLTLEFGQPELEIREPLTAPPGASGVQERLGRRRVTVTGRWHLWIYCCNWSITLLDTEVAHSESSDDVIAFATDQLDGQKLLSVRRDGRPGTWVFAFDLGGELRTWPYDDDLSDEQWLLYERDSGNVLAVWADGQCSYDSSDAAVPSRDCRRGSGNSRTKRRIND